MKMLLIFMALLFMNACSDSSDNPANVTDSENPVAPKTLIGSWAIKMDGKTYNTTIKSTGGGINFDGVNFPCSCNQCKSYSCSTDKGGYDYKINLNLISDDKLTGTLKITIVVMGKSTTETRNITGTRTS
jgi:hypothetical protein